MKNKLSLIIGVLLGCMLLFTAPTGYADDVSSVGTTQGSVILSGWGDIPKPKPNKPEGPQGNSSLKPSTGGKYLPQTNEKKSQLLSSLGLIWLTVLGLILFVFKRREKEEEGEQQ